MQCPECGGAMWDNRGNKRNPKSPDFKCKDKECGKGVWVKKRDGDGNGSGGHRAPAGAGPRSSRPLTPLYLACLTDAKAAVTHVLGKDAAPELIVNAAATLFIAASRDGTPLRAPKPKPAPPPPPPVEEEQDFEEFPGALQDDDDDLPF